MTGPCRRLLVSVEPRVFREALAQIFGGLAEVTVVSAAPDSVAAGHFDAAVVSHGTAVDAAVVVELVDESGVVVVHGADGDRTIDLRNASGLVDVVAAHLGLHGTRDAAGRDLEHHTSPAS